MFPSFLPLQINFFQFYVYNSSNQGRVDKFANNNIYIYIYLYFYFRYVHMRNRTWYNFNISFLQKK